MRISGVEICNYAGFDRQYLPLKDGVQLLVGKNNAGKSALLRLLKFQTDQSWRNYVANSTPASITVWYTPDNSDTLQTRKDTLGRTVLLPGEVVRVDISLTQAGDVRMQSAALVKPDGRTLPLIGQNLNNRMITVHWYGPNDNQGGGSQSVANYDLKQLQIPDDLKNAIWIKASRSVAYPMPASANREVPTDGRTLATFLQTLQGDRDDLYEAIQEKFCTCFPEFTKVNVKFQVESQGISQNVLVTLREKGGRRVDLQNSGAGVEQALIMLACIFGTDEQNLFLVDEPHNFLHPSLERIFVDLLLESKHSFLLATHSAQMINRVPPEQIVVIAKPGTPKSSTREAPQGRGELLAQLGYRNSDLLFHDALIFVEGPSDPAILAALFAKAGSHSPKHLDIGYVELGGTGEFPNFEAIQRLVIVQEKLLKAFSKTNLPHVYLFDGDKAKYREKLEKTRPAGTQIRPIFLEAYEVENYLLDPQAITATINAELESLGLEQTALVDAIQGRLDELLNPEKLTQETAKGYYPQGWSNRAPRIAIKGSKVLNDLYATFLLTYDKRTSGAELVAKVTLGEPAKAEIRAFTKMVRRLIFH
jgi:hypothetical protein